MIDAIQLAKDIKRAARAHIKDMLALGTQPYIVERLQTYLKDYEESCAADLPQTLNECMLDDVLEQGFITMQNGSLRVHRIVTSTFSVDIDEVSLRPALIINQLDEQVSEYVDEALNIHARRISVPALHVSVKVYIAACTLWGWAAIPNAKPDSPAKSS